MRREGAKGATDNVRSFVTFLWMASLSHIYDDCCIYSICVQNHASPYCFGSKQRFKMVMVMVTVAMVWLMKRGRGDVGVRMMHEVGDSDYTGGSICLTDTLPWGNKKQIQFLFQSWEIFAMRIIDIVIHTPCHSEYWELINQPLSKWFPMTWSI